MKKIKVNVAQLFSKVFGKKENNKVRLASQDGMLTNGMIAIRRGFDKKVDELFKNAEEKVISFEKFIPRAEYVITNVIEKPEVTKLEGKLESEYDTWTTEMYINSNYYRYMKSNNMEIRLGSQDGGLAAGFIDGESKVFALGIRMDEKGFNKLQTTEEYLEEQERIKKEKEYKRIKAQEMCEEFARTWFKQNSFIENYLDCEMKLGKNEFNQYCIMVLTDNNDGDGVKWHSTHSINITGACTVTDQKKVGKIVLSMIDEIKKDKAEKENKITVAQNKLISDLRELSDGTIATLLSEMGVGECSRNMHFISKVRFEAIELIEKVDLTEIENWQDLWNEIKNMLNLEKIGNSIGIEEVMEKEINILQAYENELEFSEDNDVVSTLEKILLNEDKAIDKFDNISDYLCPNQKLGKMMLDKVQWLIDLILNREGKKASETEMWVLEKILLTFDYYIDEELNSKIEIIRFMTTKEVPDLDSFTCGYHNEIDEEKIHLFKLNNICVEIDNEEIIMYDVTEQLEGQIGLLEFIETHQDEKEVDVVSKKEINKKELNKKLNKLGLVLVDCTNVEKIESKIIDVFPDAMEINVEEKEFDFIVNKEYIGNNPTNKYMLQQDKHFRKIHKTYGLSILGEIDDGNIIIKSNIGVAYTDKWGVCHSCIADVSEIKITKKEKARSNIEKEGESNNGNNENTYGAKIRE